MATSLRLPDELKQRVAAAAKAEGTTPHAFMLAALEQSTAASEKRTQLLDAAEQSAQDVANGGPVYKAADVHAYIRARALGEEIAPPDASL